MANILLLLCGQYILVEGVANIVVHYYVKEGRYSEVYQLGRLVRCIGGLIITYFSVV